MRNRASIKLQQIQESSTASADEVAGIPFPDFCERYIRIQNKRGEVVPLVLNPIQRDLASKITPGTWHIVVKPRQVGVTTAIKALNYRDSLIQPLRSIVMAHDDDTTQKLRRMERVMYDEMPDKFGINRSQDNASITAYSNMSEVTIKTAGSKQGGRGGTYNRFHGSELAFWKAAKKIISGAMQGVPDDGIVVWESTTNGAQGLFYKEVQKAREGKSRFQLHFYEWWWQPEYQIALEPGETITYDDDEQKLVDEHGLSPEQIKWRRQKMSEPGLDFFQEYPEDIDTCFLTSGDSAFPNFHKCLVPAVWNNELDGYVSASHPRPDPTHEYVAALDWGQDRDFSALSIFNRITRQEVFIARWRKLPYKTIRGNVIRACKFWNVRKITPEKNSMSSNVESLRDEFYDANYEISVNPFWMTNPDKHQLVTDFKEGYQSGGTHWLSVGYATQEANVFVKKQTSTGLWTYDVVVPDDDDSDSDDEIGHGDTVIARLLTLYAASQGQVEWLVL